MLKRAFALADNKLAERAGWDLDILVDELMQLSLELPRLNLDLSLIGFEPAELDGIFADAAEDGPNVDDWLPPTAGPVVSQFGALWRLGNHLILHGDARSFSDYARLMSSEQADAVITDPPYNVKIVGHAQGRGHKKHSDFAMARGEMTDEQFQVFLAQCLGHAAKVSRGGAVHFVFIDWRHVETLMRAARELCGAVLNLVVWVKANAGQGSFYRSQYELIGVLRVGTAQHENNVEQARHGRNRSNVWTYPGVNTSDGVGTKRSKCTRR
jgi:hypothetical protein